MSADPVLLARLYDIAAFERPLTLPERLGAGFETVIDRGHVATLWERAALERPLGERELAEVRADLVTYT